MTINKHTIATDLRNIYAKTHVEFSPSIRVQGSAEEVEEKSQEYQAALDTRLGEDSNYRSVSKEAMESIADDFYRILIKFGSISFYDYEAIMLRLDELVRAGAIIE